MNTQMIIIGLIFLAVFIVPYFLIKFFSAKKKLKLNTTIKSLLARSGMSDSERVEVKDWIIFLDSRLCKLAVVDKRNLDTKGEVIDIAQLKNCNVKSDADGGSLILIDLELVFKDASLPDARYTFYKFGVDRLFDARDLQHRAENLQQLVRTCIAK